MKVPILILSSVLVKIWQIPHIISQTTSRFLLKFCMTLQCHEVQILRLLRAQIKIHQILVIFETTNRFFFKFCITIRYHET